MGQYKLDQINDSTGVTNITLNPSGIPTFGGSGVVVNTYGAGNSSGETLTSATAQNVRSYDPTVNITITINNTWPAGRELIINHLGTTAGTIITLSANGTGTIATIYPKTTYRCVPITSTPGAVSDWLGLTSIQSNWVTLASGTGTNVRNGISDGGTPTINLGTGGEAFCLIEYKRQGDSIILRGAFQFGSSGAVAGAAVILGAKLPTGVSIAATGRYQDLTAAVQAAPTLGLCSLGTGTPDRVFGYMAFDTLNEATRPYFLLAALSGTSWINTQRAVSGTSLGSGSGSTLSWHSYPIPTNEWLQSKG